MKRVLIIVVMVLMILQSCKILQPHSRIVPIPLQAVTVKPPIVNKDPFVVDNKQIDILHADISLALNWAKHECNGVETLYVKPYFYPVDSVVLDAKGMILHEISMMDQSHQSIAHLVTYNQDKIAIALEHQFTRDDTIQIIIKYTARPDYIAHEKGKAIQDNKGLYFINTLQKEPNKPIQCWTQGEPEATSCWLPTIDRMDEKFTSTLTLQVRSDLTTLSNGKKVSSTIDATSKIEKWVNELPMPAYLLMFVVGEFEIFHDTTSTYPVAYYLEKQYAPFAQQIFKYTPEMIDFFESKLGVPYPWAKYDQIVVRDYVSGAMENTSATLHGDFVQKNSRELVDDTNDDIIAHELFHQWFGDLVTANSWSQLVLQEGFATFGEQLWITYKYGKDAGIEKKRARNERYVKYVKNNEDLPLVHANYRHPDDMFSIITYQKGASVINLLRTKIGDEAFYKGLQQYLQQFQFGNADIRDFQKVMEQVSGLNLSQFFTTWFLQGGHPIVDVHYYYNDTTKLLEVSVLQNQTTPAMQFPLTFLVKHGTKTKTYTFEIDKRKEIFYVRALDPENSTMPYVTVDPEGDFVGELHQHTSLGQQLYTYQFATTYLEKYQSLQSLAGFQMQSDTVFNVLLSAINDINPNIRLHALRLINWSRPTAFTQAKDLLLYMAEKDPSADVRAAVIKLIAQQKDPLQMSVLQHALQDSSYTVVAEAVEGIRQLIPAEAVHACEILMNDAKKDLMVKIAEIFAQYGEAKHLIFFTDNLMKVFQQRRVQLMEYYTRAAIRLHSEDILDSFTHTMLVRVQHDESGLIRFAAIMQLHELDNYLQQSLREKNTTHTDAFSQRSQHLKDVIHDAIQQETDEDVLSRLKLKGLYTGVKE